MKRRTVTSAGASWQWECPPHEASHLARALPPLSYGWEVRSSAPSLPLAAMLGLNWMPSATSSTGAARGPGAGDVRRARPYGGRKATPSTGFRHDGMRSHFRKQIV